MNLRGSGIAVCGNAGEAELDGRYLRWAPVRGPDAPVLDLDLRGSTVGLRLCPLGRAVLTFQGPNIFGEPQLVLSKHSKDRAQPARAPAEVRSDLYARCRVAQSDCLWAASEWNARRSRLLAFDDDLLRSIVRFCDDHDMLAVALTCTRMSKAARRSRPAAVRRRFHCLLSRSPKLETLHWGLSTGAPIQKARALFLAAARAGSLELLRELHAQTGGWRGRAFGRRLRSVVDARSRAGRAGGAASAAILAWIGERDGQILARRKAAVAERRRLWEARRDQDRARALELEQQERRDELVSAVQRQLPGWGMVHARLLYSSWRQEAEALRVERQAAFAAQVAPTR